MVTQRNLFTGVYWYLAAWKILKISPLELIGVFMYYSFAMFIVTFIPVLGPLVNIVVLPAFSILFLIATARVARGKRTNWWETLRMEMRPFYSTLFVLGGLYLVCLLLAIIPGYLMFGDAFGELILGLSQKINPSQLPTFSSFEPLVYGLLTILLCLMPVVLMFWFAPNLVVWHHMSISKALVYSLLVWITNWRVWMGYLLVTALLMVVIPSLLVMSFGLWFPGLIGSILFVYWMFGSILLYLTLYPSYVTLFDDVEVFFN